MNTEPTPEQIARTAMAKVAMVTDPNLSEQQKALLYEIHMPEMPGRQQHNGGKRHILPGGQVLDIVEDGRNQKQTYESSRSNNGITATATKRETINGFLVDFV
ncbi:MAG TPA: hypothetical protein VKL21_07735 [Candidatus Methanoperedens sp.]|jgi:hypothetical protein|nr:hypothetical protein [Candidatus Methanoperedens sp.]